jgi:hypothetical protein
MVDEETYSETWSLSKKRRNMNAWQNYNSHEIEVSLECNVNFNRLKLHLMSHGVKRIVRYIAMHQYSANRYDQPHNTNPKDSCNFSNNNLNYLLQVITIQRCIVCKAIRELNLLALALGQENSAPAGKILRS